MTKYVILSFDDGRLDTYTNAARIMDKYKLTATINIITDYIEHPQKYYKEDSTLRDAMTIENVLELENRGFEIASHSKHHINTKKDIIEGIQDLENWGINIDNIGFASPNSKFIDNSNFEDIKNLIKNNQLQYIRTGIPIRTNSYWYILKYILEEKTHSKKLFINLNKNMIFNKKNCSNILYGIGITKNMKWCQIKSLIDYMPDESCIILLLHSILSPDEDGYGIDKWYWDEKEFENLCKYLSENKNIEVIQTRELYK